MKPASLSLLSIVGGLVIALSSFQGDASEDATEHEASAHVPDAPHVRAPLNINLVIDEGTWLRAPGEEWFAAQAELDLERYSYDEDLGDEGGWKDARGAFELRYDEEEEEYAYWQWISAAQLTRGRQDFVQYCSSCHGFEGDGYGRSGQHLRPAPRSFLQKNFKFAKVISTLPSDAALMRLVKRGLAGTPMLPWDLSNEQLYDILQYIKSLSPPGEGWRDIFTEIGEVVESGEDPWQSDAKGALKRGELVYHEVASCYLCHPGYVTPTNLAALRGEDAGTKYRDTLTLPVLKESSYEVLGRPTKILPPDFTWHQMRAGTSTLDLFETIAAGIKGTAMPQWKDALSDRDIWALAHYVKGLIKKYKDQPTKRAAFMGGLRQGQ